MTCPISAILQPFFHKLYILFLIKWFCRTYRKLLLILPLTLLCWGSCSICIAQQVKKAGVDTVHIFELITKGFSSGNIDSGIATIKNAISISTQSGYLRGIAAGYCQIGMLYQARSDYGRAVDNYKTSLEFCRTPKDSANCYYNLAVVYEVEGSHVSAANYCFTGLELIDKPHVRKVVQIRLNLYSLLSAINVAMKDNAKALAYSKIAEKIAREESLNQDLVTLLNNRAGIYTASHKLDSALLLLNESFQICERDSIFWLEGETFEEIGLVYLDSGLYDRSIYYFRKSIDPQKCADDFYVITNYSSYGIAKALYKLKRYKEAETLLVKTIATGKEQNIRENLVAEYTLLADIYRATGEWQKVAYSLDTAHALSDSLTGAEKAVAINQMEMKYKSAEKDKELSHNQLLIAGQKNKIAQGRIWMMAVGGGALLLLLIGAGAYMQLAGRQRSRERENRIKVHKAVVESSDNERGRIARELHDGIGSMLGATMLRFKTMQQENPSLALTAAFKDAISILQEIGQEIRQAAHNLMPDILLKQSLTDAIKAYCETMQENGPFRLDFQSFGDFDSITDTEKLNIYRIVQELVKNASTHANAAKILVQLIQNVDGKVVSVEDNGTGFDFGNKRDGMGLPNVQTRVDSMGGQMTVESRQGKGTTIFIEIPGTLNEKNS